jgi:putative intracellular protease/amidase
MFRKSFAFEVYRCIYFGRRSWFACCAAMAVAFLIASGASGENPEQKKMNKVAVVLTSHSQLGETGRATGFYLSEVSHPVKVFREAGFDVDFISPKGGGCPVDGLKLEDPINAAFVESPDFKVCTSKTIAASDASPAEYDAIFFAGGHGTMWDLPDNKFLQEITAKIYDRGGVVAAVCHGPAGLVNVKLANGSYLVRGRTVSTFTNDEEIAVKLDSVVPFMLESKMKERGAKFEKAENFQPKVVASDRLVTGQNPASATGVAEAMVAILKPQNAR